MAAAPHVAVGAQAILTINLGALAANWKRLAARVAPAECGAVVKADAYGIGIEAAGRTLLRAGCKTFFVADANEGARLRLSAGRRRGVRIYILNGFPRGSVAARLFIESQLTPVLGSMHEFVDWSATAQALGARCFAALHVDTGMRRLGASVAEAETLLAMARARPGTGHVMFDLLMSHFVASEAAEDAHNAGQILGFSKFSKNHPGVRASLANSSGIFLPQKPFFGLVRPGYALYGGNPTPGRKNPMQRVVSLQAPILQLREIAAGESVGYNAQWTAKRPTRLATIGVGYADGLPRNLMATEERVGGDAFVAGKRCSFAGRVSMDLTVIDVTDAPAKSLAVGAMVELLGERMGIDEMGARAGTIGYEVLTALGRRYHRVYVGE